MRGVAQVQIRVHVRAARLPERAGAGCALLAAALLAASCMIGPDFVAPAAPLAERWDQPADPAVDTASTAHPEWWQLFGDPVLDRLIDTAYRQNLTLRMAGVRVLEARAKLGLAIGELYPQQQSVSAQLSYNRIPISIPYDIINNTYWQSLIGAQAAWEIDLWGKIRRGVEAADDGFLASVAEYDDVLVTLTGDVASAYIQIRTLETRIAIARENIVKQRMAVKIATNRFRGGVVSKRDVYQAEAVLGSTEASIPALTIELQQAMNGLAVLLGLPPGRLAEILGGATAIPTAPTQIAVGIPAELLRRRPDIRQAELTAAAQCAEIGVAKADLLPAFTLLGNVGTVSSDIGRGDLADLFTAKSVAYSAGPAVQWNILNYGQITNNVRIQDARFQELLIDYQQTVLEAQEEVQNGLSAYVQSRRQADFLRASTKAAEGALTIAMNQYKDGTADFTTVLTAEQNLYQAQDSLAVARGNVPLGLIATYRALGGGWEIRAGEDFVPAETRDEMAERTNWGTLLTPDLLTPQAPGLPGPEDASPLVRPPEW
jgi:NodT family efflux transporter outer membrane factor (OMF) lipoprotein